VRTTPKSGAGSIVPRRNARLTPPGGSAPSRRRHVLACDVGPGSASGARRRALRGEARPPAAATGNRDTDGAGQSSPGVEAPARHRRRSCRLWKDDAALAMGRARRTAVRLAFARRGRRRSKGPPPLRRSGSPPRECSPRHVGDAPGARLGAVARLGSDRARTRQRAIRSLARVGRPDRHAREAPAGRFDSGARRPKAAGAAHRSQSSCSSSARARCNRPRIRAPRIAAPPTRRTSRPRRGGPAGAGGADGRLGGRPAPGGTLPAG
jgi:hypothetical protein